MSTLTWIDHSEKQRRQILEAIDLFREKDTRDELGLAGIRDAFSDMLFPGTGSLQTRARYFFFVPWMYLDLESKRVPSSEVARKSREFEIKLIDRLAESSDPPPPGTIGIQARRDLQRIPSSIYWNGLKVLGICLHPGSQAQYHRSFDRRTEAGAAARRNDDGEVVVGAGRAWHAGLPSAPGTFPTKADFGLTVPEARYLRGRVLETHRSSLFAFLLDQDYEDADVAFVWEHPSAQHTPASLTREIEHARCFSEVMHGAAILYNLYLAQLDPKRDDVIEECETLLGEWISMMTERRTDLRAWSTKRDDFWTLLLSRHHVASITTHAFVDEWCDRALRGDVGALRGNPGTKELIFSRETQIKGAMARCQNRDMRWRWNGGSGLGQFDFRWSSARVLLQDMSAGLAANHA